MVFSFFKIQNFDKIVFNSICWTNSLNVLKLRLLLLFCPKKIFLKKKHENIDNNINFKSKNGEQEKLNSYYVRHFTKKIKDICKLFGLD